MSEQLTGSMVEPLMVEEKPGNDWAKDDERSSKNELKVSILNLAAWRFLMILGRFLIVLIRKTSCKKLSCETVSQVA